MFFPIGDDNSRRRTTPYLTWAILVVNAVMWLLQLRRGEPFSYGWAAVPFEITHGVDLVGPWPVEIQGREVQIPQHPGPQPIRLTLLSSMFMHGGWMHIGGNMLYLMIFADQIEDLLGRWRFLLFYLLCGLAAGFAQIAWNPESVIPCLGASGAIAGVLGAYLVKYPTNAVYVVSIGGTIAVPAVIVLLGWILLQFVGQAGSAAGAATGVAYLAHIGGFLAGLVLVFALGIGRRRERG